MTHRIAKVLSRLKRDRGGSVAIETAFVLPLLITLSLGTFDASMLVSRQYELQSAAAEAEVIAVAAASGATTNNDKVKEILKASVGLDDDQIEISQFYRCNDSDSTVDSADSCMEDDIVTTYLRVEVSDTYTPVWTEFGIGEPVDFDIERTVILP